MGIAGCSRTAAVLLASALASGAAHAVYRCGNVYQDRPCDGATVQPQAAPAKSAPPPTARAAAAQSPFAPACSRVGLEAQKMVWKREGGATQESQMADLPSSGARDEMLRTLDSVYRKRGSAPEIRAAVEAECLAEKQQAADTAAALKALQPQAGTPAGSRASPGPAAAADAGSVRKTSADSGPNPSCGTWRSELNSVNDDFRKGGNAVTMERLQNRRRDVEKSLRDGRC